MKVLVTGAGAVLGQGIIRSLRESRLPVTIIAADPSPLSAGLYWTPHRHLLPLAKDEQFGARVTELLERERPDVVIPGTDVELHAFAVHRAEWEERFATHVVVSDEQVVRIADDKFLTFEFLRSAGFAVPDSCLPGEAAQLVERVGFPLIVKPRIGARSVGVVKVCNAAELARALSGARGLMIQECVGGEEHEYTAGTLVFDGRCDASIVMRRDLRDGNTYRAYVRSYPELDEQVRRFAEALKPHGPANFQFRLDANGRARVFEINARFSGTTPFRMRAGFNEVEMVVRKLLLGEPVRQPEIQNMTILRHFEETIVLDRDELHA